MVKKAVILCGGLATRFLPICKNIPKEMLPILNKPLIDYCIEDLKNNGITDILIVLGRNKECLENYYDRNIELEERLVLANKELELDMLRELYTDVNISFVRQIYAKGTGYAVGLAKNFVGNDPFILIFPDDVIVGNSFARQLIETYHETDSSVLPLKQIDIKDSKKYGMVAIDNDELGIKITDIVEKPAPEDSPSSICYTGGGLFTPELFDELTYCEIHSNGEMYITDAFTNLIANNRLYGKIIAGNRLDFGNPLGLVKGNVIAGLNSEEFRDELVDFIKELAEKL